MTNRYLISDYGSVPAKSVAVISFSSALGLVVEALDYFDKREISMAEQSVLSGDARARVYDPLSFRWRSIAEFKRGSSEYIGAFAWALARVLGDGYVSIPVDENNERVYGEGVVVRDTGPTY